MNIPAKSPIIASVLAIVAVAAAACSSSGGGGSSNTDTIRVAYAPTAAWLPVIVAQERGFFAKHGLTVKTTQIQNLDTAIGALGRQFDLIGQTAPGTIQAASHGIDIRVVSGNTVETPQNEQLAILVPKASTIKTLAGLKGSKVGTTSLTGATNVATLAALKQQNVAASSVKVSELAFPVMGDQLKAGTVDAAENVQPFSGLLLKSGAVRNLGDPLMVISRQAAVPFTLWSAQNSWASKHARDVARWSASLREAAQFIAANPSAAISSLAKLTGLSTTIASKVLLPQYDTSITANGLNTWIQASKDAGLKTGSVSGASLLVTQ